MNWTSSETCDFISSHMCSDTRITTRSLFSVWFITALLLPHRRYRYHTGLSTGVEANSGRTSTLLISLAYDDLAGVTLWPARQTMRYVWSILWHVKFWGKILCPDARPGVNLFYRVGNWSHVSILRKQEGRVGNTLDTIDLQLASYPSSFSVYSPKYNNINFKQTRSTIVHW